MRFTQVVVGRLAPRKEGRYLKTLQSVVLRFIGKKSATPYPRKLQLRFFVSLFLMAWSLPFRLRRNPGKEVLYYDTNLSAERSEMRRYFIHKHVQNPGGKDAVLGFDGNGTFPKLYMNGLSFAKLWAIHRAMVTFSFAAFADIFRPTRIHWMWRLALVNKTFQQILWHSPDHPQYQFFSYEPSTYLSSLMVARYLKGYTPCTISSNSVQFSNNRYLCHPSLSYKLCSRFQEEETRHYIDRGWMEVGERELWGLEEALYIDRVVREEPSYDIGIYTGAFWARTKTLWRSGDLDALREYRYIENPVYQEFLPVLDAIIELKKEYGLKVKVYFHPFEFSIMREHGIRPPALDKMEANGIEWDQEGKTSWDNFYEPRVGVAMLSTIIFDRLHYGLPSYFFAGQGVLNYNLELRYLTWCKDYVYTSAEDLQMKLRKELEL